MKESGAIELANMSRHTKLRIKPGTHIPDNWLCVHSRLTNKNTTYVNLTLLLPGTKNQKLSLIII